MEVLTTVVLNPASACVAVAIHGLLQRSQTPLSWLLNPWGLGLAWWLAGYAAVRLVLLGLVDGFVWVLGPRLPKLPSRMGPKAVVQHVLTSTDGAYLVFNSVIEFIFAQQISNLLWHAPFVVRAPGSVGVLNGPVALWLLLVVDDMMYAPLHRFMHWHVVYRYVHKHHHRNTFPARGYVDAANEHPVEQIAALTLHWTAVHIVAHASGLHVGAVLAHFGLKALGACFNHTGFDLRLRLPGIEYSVRAHEMHHRKPNTNFAQYVMFWDRLMGTYKPYESGLRAPPPAALVPETDRRRSEKTD
jgi:sterol desaturase/sphingolipid hydroxylase (fatty acid hydroxylase superfamily)